MTLPHPTLVAVLAAALAALALAALPARAEAAEAGVRYAAWRACLARNHAVQASPAGRALAAEAALAACRRPQEAYLDALAGSPLLDADDVARARALLLARERDRMAGTPPLARTALR